MSSSQRFFSRNSIFDPNFAQKNTESKFTAKHGWTTQKRIWGFKSLMESAFGISDFETFLVTDSCRSKLLDFGEN